MFKQACRQIFCALENQSCTFHCAILLVWSLIKREITPQLWIKLAVTRIFSEQRRNFLVPLPKDTDVFQLSHVASIHESLCFTGSA